MPFCEVEDPVEQGEVVQLIQLWYQCSLFAMQLELGVRPLCSSIVVYCLALFLYISANSSIASLAIKIWCRWRSRYIHLK